MLNIDSLFWVLAKNSLPKTFGNDKEKKDKNCFKNNFIVLICFCLNVETKSIGWGQIRGIF